MDPILGRFTDELEFKSATCHDDMKAKVVKEVIGLTVISPMARENASPKMVALLVYSARLTEFCITRTIYSNGAALVRARPTKLKPACWRADVRGLTFAPVMKPPVPYF